jgi:excisionase family DNA binding protein
MRRNGYAENMETQTQAETWLTSAEVAAIVRVDRKTVARWAQAGKLESIRLPGGQRRYALSVIRAWLAGSPQ